MAFTEEKLEEEIKEAYKKGGIKACAVVFEKRLKEWENIQMTVAVIGKTGSGKSTLINAIRHLMADDPGAAEIGSTETTLEIHEYKHPNNEQLVLCDLPGVGTRNFPKHQYLSKINVDRYDFFLLVTSKRFEENDIWLAEEILKREKAFFFIRTHMDNEVSNEMRAKRIQPQEAEKAEAVLVDKIRRSTHEQLSKIPGSDVIIKKDRVFHIDSLELYKYDFERFEVALVENFPLLKQEALQMSLCASSKQMVRAKATALRNRIKYAAALSAAVAVVPIPGTSLVADIGILVEQTRFYYKQLGLDDDSLQRLAKMTCSEVKELQAVVLQGFGMDIAALTVRSFLAFLAYFGIALAAYAGESVLEGAICLIPVVGSALSASMSYGMTNWLLNKILDKMEAVALEVIGRAVR